MPLTPAKNPSYLTALAPPPMANSQSLNDRRRRLSKKLKHYSVLNRMEDQGSETQRCRSNKDNCKSVTEVSYIATPYVKG